MNSSFLPWMVEVGIIAVRDLVGLRRLPLPSELLATFVVFGGLGLAAESPTLRGPATTTAWGLVLATALSSKVDFLRPIGDFLSGQTGVGPAAAPVVVGAAPGATGQTNQGGSTLNAQKGF